MKLLINKPIMLHKDWREDEAAVELLEKMGVSVTGCEVLAQKVNLWEEPDFCAVADALEVHAEDGFALKKCRMFNQGYLTFLWDHSCV